MRIQNKYLYTIIVTAIVLVLLIFSIVHLTRIENTIRSDDINTSIDTPLPSAPSVKNINNFIIALSNLPNVDYLNDTVRKEYIYFSLNGLEKYPEFNILFDRIYKKLVYEYPHAIKQDAKEGIFFLDIIKPKKIIEYEKTEVDNPFILDIIIPVTITDPIIANINYDLRTAKIFSIIPSNKTLVPNYFTETVIRYVFIMDKNSAINAGDIEQYVNNFIRNYDMVPLAEYEFKEDYFIFTADFPISYFEKVFKDQGYEG